MNTGANLMSAKALAEYLGVPLQTVYQWSHRGGGPPAIRVGRHLRYRPEQVEEWLNSHASGEVA